MQNADGTRDTLALLFKADKTALEAHRLDSLNRITESGPLFQQALELKQQALGPDDAFVAPATDALGLHCMRIKDYQKSEELFKRAIEILEKAYYADHANIASVASHLGDCYAAQGKWEDAEAAYKRSMEIHGKTLVGDHHDILASTLKLVEAQRKLQKYGDAETLLKKAVKTADTPLGPLEEVHYALSEIYRAAGKNAEAEASYKDAIKAFEQRDKLHRLADCLDTYAKFLRAENRSSEAEPLEKRATGLRAEYTTRDSEDNMFATTLMRA